MNSEIVKQGQSFLDKVTQLTGNYENAIAAAILNNRSITDTVAISETINVNGVTNKRVLEFFNQTSEPATVLTMAQIDAIENIGIGEMIIGSTFIVG